MASHRIFATPFSKVYPLYLQKAMRKGRSKEEVDRVICWLTGYELVDLERQIALQVDFEQFFNHAPQLNSSSSLVTGVVCGVRVEELADPLMKKIRILDKLIDELAKGKTMGKVLRQ